METRLATLDDTATLDFLRHERTVLQQQSDARLLQQRPPIQPFETLLADAQTRVWVGVIAGKIAGYLVSHHTSDAHIGLMSELTLDAHKYHGGLGRALVSTASDDFRKSGITRYYVQVARYHAVEQAFWRALGAVPAIELPQHLFAHQHVTSLTWMQINLSFVKPQ